MRCRSVVLVAALLGVPMAFAPGAASVAFEPAMSALASGADRTVALPLGAPIPAGSTGLGPGTFLLTEVEGKAFVCTANWIWRDAGGAFYLGAAGHCFLPESATSSHGRDADASLSGVRVRACIVDCEFAGGLGIVLGGSTVELGPVAFARQSRNGVDIGNDFGLVRIPDHLLGEVRTSMPVWGRAGGVTDVLPGDVVCLYGHGLALGEVFATKARAGAGMVTLADGSWRIAAPSAPGDSGAAVATCRAMSGGLAADRAVGILTHLSGSGVAGTTMLRAQQLAREAGLSVTPIL